MPGFTEMAGKLPNAEQVKTFCIKNLKRCAECACRKWGPPPHGRPIQLLGREFRTCCGYADFGVENLTAESFDMMVELSKLWYEMAELRAENPDK